MEAFDPFLESLFDLSFVFSGGGTLAWMCRLYRYLYVSENKTNINLYVFENKYKVVFTCPDVFDDV